MVNHDFLHILPIINARNCFFLRYADYLAHFTHTHTHCSLLSQRHTWVKFKAEKNKRLYFSSSSSAIEATSFLSGGGKSSRLDFYKAFVSISRGEAARLSQNFLADNIARTGLTKKLYLHSSNKDLSESLTKKLWAGACSARSLS